MDAGEDPENAKSNRITRSFSRRKRKKKWRRKRGSAERQRRTCCEKSVRARERLERKKERTLPQTDRSVRRPSEASSKARSRRGEHDDMSEISFGRLWDISGRVSRSVKTFVSRPMREPAVKKFISRIEARRRAEINNPLTKKRLDVGQVAYPRSRSRSLGERLRNGPDQSVAEEMALSKEKPAELVAENNDNDGRVIVNGQPFWLAGEEWRQIDSDESDTDDDLPLNGDIVLEVDQGKVKLEEMPAVPVTLDPFGDLKELKRRDKLFFTKSVLFGNSVRSMINLSDTTSTKPQRKRTRIATLSFDQPDSRLLYRRERFWEFTEYPYTLTCVTRAKAHGQCKVSPPRSPDQRQERLAEEDDQKGSEEKTNNDTNERRSGEQSEKTGNQRPAIYTPMY